jgi:hypothetical protein
MITIESPGPLSLDILFHDWDFDFDPTVAILEGAHPAEGVVWRHTNCQIATTAETMLAWMTLARLNAEAQNE